MNKHTYTITFGDVAENHVGMQKIGQLHLEGYSVNKLKNLMEYLVEKEFQVEYVDISYDGNEAGVLVIRKGIQKILKTDNNTEEITKEHRILPMDTKAFMKGRVVNKIARYNLCFDEESQEPNYEEGRGRIVTFSQVPLTKIVRKTVSDWLGEIEPLKAEANYYYDIGKCGIGYHGDSERRKVIAFRLGETIPICFQWFQKSIPVGDKIEISLEDGDMYIMSEKAVGFDWKKKLIPTVRHATGCVKYTEYKNKKNKKK